MSITITQPEAARRAIAWAKANPDKILSGQLAGDGNGRTLSTLDRRATCFCLVGRMAYETGINVTRTNAALETFVENYQDVEADADELWEANDAGVNQGDPLRGFRMLEELIK